MRFGLSFKTYYVQKMTHEESEKDMKNGLIYTSDEYKITCNKLGANRWAYWILSTFMEQSTDNKWHHK